MIMGAFNVLWVCAVIRQMLDERGMREKVIITTLDFNLRVP